MICWIINGFICLMEFLIEVFNIIYLIHYGYNRRSHCLFGSHQWNDWRNFACPSASWSTNWVSDCPMYYSDFWRHLLIYLLIDDPPSRRMHKFEAGCPITIFSQPLDFSVLQCNHSSFVAWVYHLIFHSLGHSD